MASVSISNISKSYAGTSVLRQVSIDVRDGEFLSLVGPSGCGKSTLLRAIAGFEQQDDGEIHIGGRRIDHLRPSERDVAMVFQSYALYPHLTAYDNIAAPLRMRRLKPLQRLPLLGRLMPSRRAAERQFREDISGIADMLQLDALLGRKPAQLSGGQRQRVALARSIVRQPAVFLMDEPLSNLDAKLRDSTRAELAALHRRLGATFIYVTHDQAEAMTMSDRIAVMMDGEILQTGTPHQIYNDPQDMRLAEFIGSPPINVISGTRNGAGVAAAGITFAVDPSIAPGQKVALAFRPHAAGFATTVDAGGLAGRVVHVENLGSDLFVHVRLDVEDASARAIIVRQEPSASAPQIGAPARVRVDPKDIFCFDAATGARLPDLRRQRAA